MTVHVIPVPDGMTPEEAFAEIQVFGKLAEGREVSEDGEGGSWAVVEEIDTDARWWCNFHRGVTEGGPCCGEAVRLQ